MKLTVSLLTGFIVILSITDLAVWIKSKNNSDNARLFHKVTIGLIALLFVILLVLNNI